MSGEEMLEYVTENSLDIKDGASIDFIESLIDKSMSWDELSDKQQKWVEDIYERIAK